MNRATLALIALLLLTPALASAGTTGIVSGRVTDVTTGAPLQDVQIRVFSGSAIFTVRPDEHGFYDCLLVPPGKYSVTFETFGHSPQWKVVQVFADETTRVNATMTTALGFVAGPDRHNLALELGFGSSLDLYVIDSQTLSSGMPSP